MTQKQILSHYNDNGGLRCKDWALSEIKKKIKADFGTGQRVCGSTCRELKQTAQMYQN